MTETTQQTVQDPNRSPTAKSYSAKAYAASSATSRMAPITIQRRAPTPSDVQIEVLFCGVCHSDLHQVRNEWEPVMPTVYPCVPGHEIVGRVVKTGSAALSKTSTRAHSNRATSRHRAVCGRVNCGSSRMNRARRDGRLRIVKEREGYFTR